MKQFHDFVKEKRKENELSLREFCRATELDPSNWSKIERGIAVPPKSSEVLTKIAEILNLSEDETYLLKDLALIGAFPGELKPSDSILEKLPVFFRTVRGDKPTREELERLIKTIREE